LVREISRGNRLMCVPLPPVNPSNAPKDQQKIKLTRSFAPIINLRPKRFHLCVERLFEVLEQPRAEPAFAILRLLAVPVAAGFIPRPGENRALGKIAQVIFSGATFHLVLNIGASPGGY